MYAAPVLGFADIVPGARYAGRGRTLTEADHGLFMMLSGDWDPIHADEEYARTTPAGRRLMHGTLGITLAMGMQSGAVAFADPIVGALSLSEWTFRKPLFIGDTVHVEVEFIGTRVTSRGDRYIAERWLRLLRHDNVVIQDGIVATMLQLGKVTT